MFHILVKDPDKEVKLNQMFTGAIHLFFLEDLIS